MTFPPSLVTIEITGLDMTSFDGTPLTGAIIFTPSVPVYNVAGSAVLEGSATMTVTDGVGATITVPCTDSVSPAFTYTIEQRLNTPDGVNPAPVPGVVIPHALGSSVDVSSLL